MKYQINILKKKELTFFEKLIYFFLHYIRYIVVLTQIVVIFVFFYRFKVDQEVIELKEMINEKQEIINVTHPLIEQAEIIDFKTNNAKVIINKQKQFINNFNYILSIIPERITLNKFEINHSEIKLSGITSDINSIRFLYEKIRREGKFKDATIDKITKDNLNFDFLISIKIS